MGEEGASGRGRCVRFAGVHPLGFGHVAAQKETEHGADRGDRPELADIVPARRDRGANEVGTYNSELRADGTLYGEGQGVVLTQDGGMATWKGSGQGTIQPNGTVSYRGTIYYRSASANLAALNAAPGVFEFEVDAAGNTKAKVWQWK